MGYINKLIFRSQLVICRLMFINKIYSTYISKSLETYLPQCQGFDCRSFWICAKRNCVRKFKRRELFKRCLQLFCCFWEQSATRKITKNCQKSPVMVQTEIIHLFIKGLYLSVSFHSKYSDPISNWKKLQFIHACKSFTRKRKYSFNFAWK